MVAVLQRIPSSGFLSIALGLVVCMASGCGLVARGVSEVVEVGSRPNLFHHGRYGELTEREEEWAKIAWKYFENNVSETTGLVNSLDAYPSASMWHLADYLAALMAAREFDFVNAKEFDTRLSTVLKFLNEMPLFFNRLPNKLYHTEHGGMIDYANQPAEQGWSALDIGRLLIWLKLIAARYPEYSEYIDRAVLRWNFCDVIDRCGTMYAGARIQDKVELFQEGRLGYEEYAATGFQLWGFNTRDASDFEPKAQTVIHGVEIPYDARDARTTGTYSPVLSGPYIYHGLEFAWDEVYDRRRFGREPTNTLMADMAQRVYDVQEARYINKRIFTARTDHNLAQAPYFLYDSIFSDGYAWNSIADNGEAYPQLALVATRAAFGMWALWDTEYTDRLMLVVKDLCDPEKGWFEGRYENSGGHDETFTASTNALILESLLYKRFGKLYQAALEPSYGQLLLLDQFKQPGKCFPPERPICE